MKFPFNARNGLIQVQAEFAAPNGPQTVTLSVDSGATQSAIALSKLVAGGYGFQNATAIYAVATAGGVVNMLEFVLPALTSLGRTLTDLPVMAAHDVAGVTHDGLLGLDFLRDRILTINFQNGTIELQ